jgi:diguanylate cyclase (GGDEF)-like protein
MTRVRTMPSEEALEIAATLSSFMLDVMMLAEPPPVPAGLESVEPLQRLYGDLISLRDVLYASSSGDLSKKIRLNGYTGGALKSLQANLRHLTWQTKMVAAGDFSQRVDFMGEFADAFNAMVVQLDQTLTELLAKKTELSGINAELLREIGERKRIEAALRRSREDLKRLAITDSLTGLYNRGYFNRVAAGEIERALRYSHPLSIMMFDIDHFKRINDTYGHSSGDRVLKMIAATTSGIFRVSDVLARYGGEEFVALLYETSAPKAVEVAERLRQAIERSVVQSDRKPIRVTASFGVSDRFGRTDAQPVTEILSEFIASADQAMYASKNAGRNRVTLFRSD